MKVWEVLGFQDPEGAVLELENLARDRESTSDEALFVSGIEKALLLDICTVEDFEQFKAALFFKQAVRSQDARAFVAGLWLLFELGLDRSEVCVFERSWSDAGRLRPESVLGQLASLLQWLEAFPFHPSSPEFIRQYAQIFESTDFGEFSIELRREIKRYLAYYEAFVSCFFKGEGGSYREALADSFAIGILKNWSKVLHTPELTVGVKDGRIKDRIESIRILYGRCSVRGNPLRPEFGSASWPRLVAATAGWFTRVALQYRRWGMTNAGLMALVRVSEMAMVAALLEQGVVKLAPGHGGPERRGRRTKGAGEYVSYFEDGVCLLEATTVDYRKQWVATARRILAARNNSRLGHGLAELSSDAFDEVYGDLNWCLKGLLSPGLRDEFDLSFLATKETAPAKVITDLHSRVVDNALENLV